MKLRPLLITLAVLIPASGAVWFLQRPAPAAQAADSRIGQRLADPALLTNAVRVQLKASGNSLELSRNEAGRWTVAATKTSPALPADASRLTNLTSSLVSPKIERLVTSNPSRLSTLELDSTNLTFLDAAGKSLIALDLGKTADGGGRFVRYGTEAKAYLARFESSIDADAASWRDTALAADLKPENIASISFTFPDSPAAVVLSRHDAKSTWTSPDTPAGNQIKSSIIDTQLNTLTGLRFTNVTPVVDPGVIAARIVTRDVKLTTFEGRSVKLSLGRALELPKKPQPTPPVPPEPPPAPRPVYVEITDSKPDAILAVAATTHAFEIAEWTHSGLPANSADLFEPVHVAPAPQATAVTPPLSAHAHAPKSP